MEKIRIKLVAAGNLKCRVDFGFIEGWKSKIFSIEPLSILGALPNSKDLEYGYSDRELAGLIHAEPGVNITIALIHAPLEGNFYARVLTASILVVSLFEMSAIIERAEHRIEDFILRCVYESVLMFIEGNQSLNMGTALRLSHDEVRHCLFDMNMDKADIVFSLDPPTLCDECKVRLSKRQIDDQFISILDSEMKRIRKGLYHRVTGWAKVHPVSTLLITTAFGLFLNVAGNLLYDGGKWLMSNRQPIQVTNPPTSSASPSVHATAPLTAP